MRLEHTTSLALHMPRHARGNTNDVRQRREQVGARSSYSRADRT
jgi:hypothetical protein